MTSLRADDTSPDLDPATGKKKKISHHYPGDIACNLKGQSH